MRESLKEFLDIIESCNEPTTFHLSILENIFLIYTKGWKEMGLTETEKETLINAILDQFSKLRESKD